MKNVKITLLYFLFSALGILSAIGADQVEKIVGTIANKAQVNRFGPDASDFYGFQSYWRDMNIDASQSEFENLVLKMRVYIDNLDNPGDISFIQNAGFAMIELANSQTPTDTYVQWGIKPLNLVHGWNDVVLPLTTGDRKSNFDLSKPLNWFRFGFARIQGEPDAIQIRLMDIQLVDKSVLVDPPGDGEDDNWNTDYNVADVPYTMEGTITSTGGFSPGKSFEPIDASAHNPKQLYLMMDVDIAEQNPGDIFVLSKVSGQIELTSGGRADMNELQWGINTPAWKVGKHTYTLALSNGGETGGPIDLSNINFMRLYAVNVPSDYTGKITFKVDNVKIVDMTNETKLPTLFNDQMMFQQNKPIKIWGHAIKGKNITVSLYKNDNKLDEKTAITPESGKWEVIFDAQKGSYDKYKFIVSEGTKTIQTVDDILIGEVWLSSGQSNMALTVAGAIDGNTLMAEANNSNVRFFLEPTYPSGANGPQPYEPADDISGAIWGSGSDGMQVGKVSAVAYRVALELQEELDIPVGILNTAVGGSVIEAWIPREEIDSNQDLVLAMKRKGLYFDKDWWVDAANSMTVLYNQKVGPLKGYNIAGVIWYQGESNSARPELYAVQLDLMKKGYEKLFGFAEGTMPFVFSHVAPWVTELNNPQALAVLAEAMYDVWEMNKTSMGMLPIYDTDLTYVGNVPIHPTNKTPVGKRFAKSVINLVYNKPAEYTAPVFNSMSVSGDKIIVKFDHVGEGLKTTNGLDDIRGFAICGEDGIYVNAKAKIKSKNEVEVWNDRLKNPKQVTYAYATYNVMSNLTNSVEIAAAPFRSDRTLVDQKYFNPQDWMYADGDIWGIDGSEFVGFIPAWGKALVSGSNNVSFSYDETLKSEGKASLKIEYVLSADGITGVGPILTNKTTVSQLENFNTISVDVLNPDQREKEIGLWIKDNTGRLYKVVFVGYIGESDEQKTAVSIEKTQGFRKLSFKLKTLVDADNQVVEDVSEVLKNVAAIQFVISDNTNGTVYIDNITFGMETEKQDLPTNVIASNIESIIINASGGIISISSREDLLQAIEIINPDGKIEYLAKDINKQLFSFTVSSEKKILIAKIQTENNGLCVKKILIN